MMMLYRTGTLDRTRYDRHSCCQSGATGRAAELRVSYVPPSLTAVNVTDTAAVESRRIQAQKRYVRPATREEVVLCGRAGGQSGSGGGCVRQGGAAQGQPDGQSGTGPMCNRHPHQPARRDSKQAVQRKGKGRQLQRSWAVCETAMQPCTFPLLLQLWLAS